MKPYAAPPFGDGMVLQRDVPVRIWGHADPEESVTICLQGKTVTTLSDPEGNWQTIIAQLAPFGETPDDMSQDFPVIRQKQEKVAGTVSGVWLASTSDAGHPYDIHPKEKRPVGTRMALLALQHVYALPITGEAPCVSGISHTQDMTAVHFDHAQGGLAVMGDHIQSLQLFDADCTEIPKEQWNAWAEGSQLIIQMKPDAPQISQIAFGATPFYRVNLYNMAGLPVRPFTVKV